MTLPLSPGRLAWLAIRPRTLGLALAPVTVGSALAWTAGQAPRPGVLLATLVAALLIQIATNLHNDAVDGENGNDGADRVGPLRLAAAGLARPATLRRAAFACLGGALLLGLWLAVLGGPLIIAIGLASLLAAAAYSGGPWPISRTPLGEVFVILFFGLLAVLGSAHLQGRAVDGEILRAGLLVGLPAAAVLLVNNVRDRRADARAGRRTLALCLPPGWLPAVYGGLVATPLFLALAWPQGGWLWLAAPLVGWQCRDFVRARTGADYNRLLAATARTALLQALLFAGLLFRGSP